MRQETKDDIKQLIEMSNARFESLRQEMNARFEALQKQIDGVQRQIAFMQWWFSIGGGLTLLLIILKLFFPHIFPH